MIRSLRSQTHFIQWMGLVVIWVKSSFAATMNISGGRTPTNPAKPPYKANQLEKIRNELSPYANSGESSLSGQQSPQPQHNQQVTWSLYLFYPTFLWFSSRFYFNFIFLSNLTHEVDHANEIRSVRARRRHVTVRDIVVNWREKNFNSSHCLRLK